MEGQWEIWSVTGHSCLVHCACQLSVASVHLGERGHGWSLLNRMSGSLDWLSFAENTLEQQHLGNKAHAYAHMQRMNPDSQLLVKCGDLELFSYSHINSPSENIWLHQEPLLVLGVKCHIMRRGYIINKNLWSNPEASCEASFLHQYSRLSEFLILDSPAISGCC